MSSRMQLSRLRGGPSIFDWGLVKIYLRIKAVKVFGSRYCLGKFGKDGLGRGGIDSFRDQRDEVFFIKEIY